MKRALFALVLLTLTYALTLASFAPLDLVAGAVLSGAVLIGLRGFIFDGRPSPLPGLARRTVAFVPFAGAVVWDVTAGTWEVALVTLKLRPLVSPGIVAVPFGERSEIGIVVSALATTLSPGTVLVDLDHAREVMLIHTIDASDPDGFRGRLESFYQRHQKRVFP